MLSQMSEEGRLRLKKTVKMTRAATTFALKTLVIHPAVFIVLFAVWFCDGDVGGTLLNEAESMVRNAPAGEVWQCVGSSETPGFNDTQKADCIRTAIPREDWIDSANHSVILLYKTGVYISLLAFALGKLVMLRANKRS